MNTYYLKKFRKIAQRRLKIKVHNGAYDLMLRISFRDWKPLKDWVYGGFMSYNNLPYAIDMLKKELEKTVKEFFDGIKQQKRLEVQDLRYLCEQGIPAMEIMVHNIPMDCFKKGLEEWLDGLGK